MAISKESLYTNVITSGYTFSVPGKRLQETFEAIETDDEISFSKIR